MAELMEESSTLVRVHRQNSMLSHLTANVKALEIDLGTSSARDEVLTALKHAEGMELPVDVVNIMRACVVAAVRKAASASSTEDFRSYDVAEHKSIKSVTDCMPMLANARHVDGLFRAMATESASVAMLHFRRSELHQRFRNSRSLLLKTQAMMCPSHCQL